jgi:hypothetical protein
MIAFNSHALSGGLFVAICWMLNMLEHKSETQSLRKVDNGRIMVRNYLTKLEIIFNKK